MADISYIPDGNNQANNILPWMLAAGNGGFGGFGGFGGGAGLSAFLGGALGAIIPNFFGWGNGGFGNAAGGAGFISNQLSNESGRELLMNAITSQGEASRTATQSLATMLGQDFNLVNSDINTLSTALSQLAMQEAVSVPQIINSIQSGNASLASQLCQCCCENRLAICQQTNAIQSDIAGVRTAIEAKAAADQLAMCQQTYTLTDTMNRNALALDNKIDALESSRKDREITALTAKVAQLESQNFTTGVVGSAVAPINAALSALAKEVDDIKCKQPSTATVQWPNLQAVNVTPYVSGGFYQGGYNGYYGSGVPGFGGGINF